jgi:hypothetical protein
MSRIVAANFSGSSVLTGKGIPWATSQNGPRRFQIAPKIIKVAVPWLKHSCKLGHDASSHTEFNFATLAVLLGIFIFNQLGFFKVVTF